MNRRSEGDVGYRFSCGLGGTDVFNFDIKTWEGRKKREKVGGGGLRCRAWIVGSKNTRQPRAIVYVHTYTCTCAQTYSRVNNRETG